MLLIYNLFFYSRLVNLKDPGVKILVLTLNSLGVSAVGWSILDNQPGLSN